MRVIAALAVSSLYSVGPDVDWIGVHKIAGVWNASNMENHGGD